MNALFAAVCFLFLLCGHGHRHHATHTASPAVKCRPVLDDWGDFKYSWHQGYGSDVHQDDFVKRYPAAQQRAVLVCIDKSEKETK